MDMLNTQIISQTLTKLIPRLNADIHSKKIIILGHSIFPVMEERNKELLGVTVSKDLVESSSCFIVYFLCEKPSDVIIEIEIDVRYLKEAFRNLKKFLKKFEEYITYMEKRNIEKELKDKYLLYKYLYENRLDLKEKHLLENNQVLEELDEEIEKYSKLCEESLKDLKENSVKKDLFEDIVKIKSKVVRNFKEYEKYKISH